MENFSKVLGVTNQRKVSLCKVPGGTWIFCLFDDWLIMYFVCDRKNQEFAN